MYFEKHKRSTQKGLYALFCVFTSFFSLSQSISNLVNNYSAEQYSTCPFGNAQVRFANFWYLPTGTNGSSDYFHSCSTSSLVSVPNNVSGNQFAKTGNAYFGFALYGITFSGIPYREYLGNGLKKGLINGKTYCINYYVSLAEFSRYACDNIGIVFSNDSLLNITSWPPQPILLNPDFESSIIIADTINWVPIQGQYSANGTERFITLGNFRTDLNTNATQVKPLNLPPNALCAYYYIDDISVVEINNANAYLNDSIIKCATDSVILGTDSTEFAAYQWQSTAAGLAALSCTDCPNPIAKPAVTTKYYLTKQQCSATTKDSVTVVVLTPTTQANAGQDKVICLGESIQIGTQDSLKFTTYNWQFNGTLSCTNCAMPFANPNVTTTYTVQRTECASITMDTVRVTVDDCEPTFTVANVFTPNDDDVNDTWSINFSTVNSHIKNFKMSIYDRWGLLVYETNPNVSTPKSKWDGHTNSGEECSGGVYFYIITFEKNEEHILLKGNLSLFR